MIEAEDICKLLTELLTGKSSMSEVCNAIMNFIKESEEHAYNIGSGEGFKHGEQTGYEQGRRDAMRNVESNVMGYNSLSGYDRERLMRIVRTGSPY